MDPGFRRDDERKVATAVAVAAEKPTISPDPEGAAD
jgi:hypothetical protein